MFQSPAKPMGQPKHQNQSHKFQHQPHPPFYKYSPFLFTPFITFTTSSKITLPRSRRGHHHHIKHNMDAVQSWVSDHKLTTIGALWASGIGASLVAYSCKKSPMKPSLRLIHARMHAQALTLAVLSGAAAYHYYEKGSLQPKPVADNNVSATNLNQIVEYEIHCPF